MPRHLLMSAAALLFLTGFFLASPQWEELIYRLIVEGFYAIAWVLGATGIGAMALRIARVRIERRALAFATFAGLGLGIMSLLVLGMGLMGWLSQWTAIGLLVAGLLAGAMCVRNVQIQLSKHTPVLLLLMPTLGLVVAGAFMLPGVLWSDEPAGYDVLAYHFQVPREWFELGRIVALKHNVFSYFPFNVEMHYLLAMHLRGGAYEGMYLAQLMHAAFVGLSVVAVVGFNARSQSGVIAALVMASFPWVMLLGPIGYNEGGLLLFGTLAVVWVMRSNLLLAGVMTGFACGSKLTAIPVLLLAIPLIEIVGRRLSLKSAAIFFAAAVVSVSPWLVRNMAWVGNPVFPEGAKILGQGHFTDAQVERWNDAHQPKLGVGPRVTAIWEQFLGNWRWGFVLIPLGIIAIALSWRRGDVRFLATLMLVQLILWIGFTHVQGRFLILAIPIVGMLIGLVEIRRWFGVATGACVISTALGWVMLYRIILNFPLTIGVESFEPVMRVSILPVELARWVYESDRPVVLVGDAQAFMYSIPMSRLHYRTVFDVVDWINPTLPPDAAIVGNPVELRRLSRTYANLPPLPPGAEEQELPFILPRP